MGRLTSKYYNEDEYYMNCPEDCDIDDCGGCIKFDALVDKLGEYEDAEEQGLLVRLPCKLGDTVYEVVKKRVDLTGYRMEWGWETGVEAVKFKIGMTDSVGKTVFLTREEAEAMLKGEDEDA